MVDTERMRRVLDRIRPGPPPPPEPWDPGPPGPPPGAAPFPPPGPPPLTGPTEWLRQEGRLAEILRRIGQKSPALRRSMGQLLADSRQRQSILRRWGRGYAVPPRQERDAPVSVLLRRGIELAERLKKDYRRAGEEDPRFRPYGERLARSAGETERQLQTLQRRLRR